MSAEKRIITKCHYRYSQINNFIAVKDFMFVREKGANHLLIRFCNFSDFTINSLAFTIVELDAAGQMLRKLKVKKADLDILPGNTYAPDVGFKVSEDCCDCKIIFRRVKSGNYIYRIHENTIIADYCKPQRKLVENGSEIKSGVSFCVKSNRTKRAKASVFWALIGLIIIITVNSARPFALYYKNEIEAWVKDYTESILQKEETSTETDDSST